MDSTRFRRYWLSLILSTHSSVTSLFQSTILAGLGIRSFQKNKVFIFFKTTGTLNLTIYLKICKYLSSFTKNNRQKENFSLGSQNLQTVFDLIKRKIRKKLRFSSFLAFKIIQFQALMDVFRRKINVLILKRDNLTRLGRAADDSSGYLRSFKYFFFLFFFFYSPPGHICTVFFGAGVVSGTPHPAV